VQSGEVRLDAVDGTAVVRNDHGETTIGDITGSLQLASTDGGISVLRAQGDVEARTAHGQIRIGEVAQGLVTLTSAFGEIEVGIRKGSAAKLDLHTVAGQVRNFLETVPGPGQGDDIVEVRAQTFDGDIVIERS
jgi:DUF4097 and DUF4098 domain-containing protein YvlB